MGYFRNEIFAVFPRLSFIFILLPEPLAAGDFTSQGSADTAVCDRTLDYMQLLLVSFRKVETSDNAAAVPIALTNRIVAKTVSFSTRPEASDFGA
jgi:hypothetical protein